MAISLITFLIVISVFWILLLIVANMIDLQKYGIFVSPLLLLIKVRKLGDLAFNISQRLEDPLKKAEKALIVIGLSLFIALPISLVVNLFIPSAPIFSVLPVTALTIENLLMFVFSLFIALGIHETAHAVMAFSKGEEVETIGIGILGFFAVAFSQFPKASLPSMSAKTRINVIVAGILANLVFVALLTPVAIFSEDLTAIGFERKSGAYIISVDPFGPADLANITSGTVVTEISTIVADVRTRVEPVTSHLDLINYLQLTAPGTLIELVTNRGNPRLMTSQSTVFPNGSSIGVTAYYYYVSKLSSSPSAFPFYFTLLIHWLLNVNLFLALYNLLPIPFSDGDRLLETIFPQLEGKKRKGIYFAAAALLAANLLKSMPIL